MAHTAFLALPWRWLIPLCQLALYVALVRVPGWPPKPDAAVAFDLSTPSSVQLAFAINSPAYLLANVLITSAGWEGETLVRLVGCLLLPQWWAVGWWLEHLGTETLKSRRNRHPFVMILWRGLFGITIALLAAAWWRILSEPSLLQSEPQQVIIGCGLWPIFVIAASWQQIRLNRRGEAG